MTMHEADRPTDYHPVEENDEVGGSDVLTDEQDDFGADPDAEVADADLEEPGEYEPDTTEPREHVAVAAVPAEGEDAEPEPVETDEAGEPARAELADDGDRLDAAGAGRTPGSDPRERLAPVGSDSPLDPGEGGYEDRWGAIQAGFIDDPGRTVESASALLAEIGDEITRSITGEREGIDDRWRTSESSTDDLRVAMQDYRTLYGRLTRFTSGA